MENGVLSLDALLTPWWRFNATILCEWFIWTFLYSFTVSVWIILPAPPISFSDMEQHFHGARLGCAGTALSEQHRSQSAVVKSTALLHAHTLLGTQASPQTQFSLRRCGKNLAACSSLPALLSLPWNHSKHPKQQNTVPVSVGLPGQLPVGVWHAAAGCFLAGWEPGGWFSALSNHNAAVNELIPAGAGRAVNSSHPVWRWSTKRCTEKCALPS